MPTKMRRTPWVTAILSLTIAFALFSAAKAIQYSVRPNSGFLFGEMPADESRTIALPVTPAAAQAVADLHGLLVVESINGAVPDLHRGMPPSLAASRMVDLRPGASNAFVLRSPSGEVRSFTIPVGRFDVLSYPYRWALVGYSATALLYLGFGLLIWLRKPGDEVAEAFLLFSLVGAVSMFQIPPFDEVSHFAATVAGLLIPMFGATGIALALAFTRQAPGLGADRVRRSATAVSLVLVVGGIALYEVWARGGPDRWVRLLMIGVGVHLLASIGVMLDLCRRAARPPNPPGMRTRAKIFGAAVAIAFVIPSLQLIVLPLIDRFPEFLILLDLILFASFPCVIGFAIARYQMFDLRIALQRRVIYVILSILISLTYAALVMGVLGFLGPRVTGAPLVLGATILATVLVVSLLQFQVQRGVERWVYRRRYVYAKAVARSSEVIARARSLRDATENVRQALLESMALSRASLVLVNHQERHLIELGNLTDRETGKVPPPVAVEDPDPMLERAFAEQRPLSAHDVETAEAFWRRHGLEMILPLIVGGGDETRCLGALLIGPRISARALDRQDLELLTTLTNQLAIAIDNANAFDEIRRLKEGLEEKVRERTRELRTALSDLQEAEGMVVEAETNALLGRLVAGIVHEINTPLGAMMSSADTMAHVFELLGKAMEAPPERALRALSQGASLACVQRQSTERIAHLVGNLERFVNLDQAERKVVDVRESLDATLELLAAEARDRIEITKTYPPVAATVLCQPLRLNQVFLSVIQNAIDAIDGGGRVDVQVVAHDGEVQVTVTDTGRGIPADQLAHVFDFGFSRKKGRVGLRLGLPTSRRALTDMGGRIEIVESAPGAGTTVCVALPVDGAAR